MKLVGYYDSFTRCMYLAVQGFRSEKGIRSSLGSFSRASLAGERERGEGKEGERAIVNIICKLVLTSIKHIPEIKKHNTI